MIRFLLPVFICLSFLSVSFGQRTCATAEVMEQEMSENPVYRKNQEDIEKFTEEYVRKYPNGDGKRVVRTIPVVFHVVYNTAEENVSDAQLLSQLDVLNKDFRFLNADKVNVPSAFLSLAADAEIEFCLAQQSPTGQATTGINRRQNTTVTSWTTTNTNLKYTANGGLDGWDRTRYLNIWVCNLGSGVYGYSTLPGVTPAAVDGVVLNFRHVGTIGTVLYPFDKGRTGTHEVAHWLNLRHLWGDATCGTDNVTDTPLANTFNTGCPAYGHRSTCKGTPIEMVNNYMDYTDDGCMNMFTKGQKTRMQALFASGGARASLLTSPGCLPPAGSCTVPSGLAASSVTASSATVTWQATAGATSYSIQYRPLGTATWTVVDNIAQTSYALASLNSSTTYEVQAKNNCSTSASSFTASQTFTTSAQVLCVAPSGLTMSNISSSNATVSWTGYLGAVDYSVQLQEPGSTTWTTSGTVAQGTTSFTFTNLTPNALYYIRVSSNCTGEVLFSSNLAFTTANSVCTAPTGLGSAGATSSTVTCSWNGVIGALSYVFECSPAGTNTWTTHNLTTTSIAMSGLLQGTTYNMRVLTMCPDGTSSQYTTGQFSTISDIICAAPANLAISNVTSSGGSASWSSVSGGLSYIFEYRVLGSTAAWSVSTNLTTTSYNFGGLLANTNYEGRVKTNCNGISSTYSGVVNFTTGTAPVTCSDSYESNTKSNSLAIPINGVAFDAKLTSSTDQDWYKFSNTSTAKNIRIVMTNLPANYNVYLYRGNTLSGTGGLNTGTLDEKIIYNNTLSASTFYVKVVGVNGVFNADACYKLSALISATTLTAQDEGGDLALREEVTAEPVIDEFLVFPNPAQSTATLLMPMQGQQSGILRVMDISGKVVLQEEVWSDEAIATKEINLDNTAPGMYILSFVSGQNVSTTRLVVER